MSVTDVESIPFHEFGDPETHTLRVGDTVWDDLTGTKAKVTRISVSTSEPQTVGIWLDSEYLDGGRHPWEISLIRD